MRARSPGPHAASIPGVDPEWTVRRSGATLTASGVDVEGNIRAEGHDDVTRGQMATFLARALQL